MPPSVGSFTQLLVRSGAMTLEEVRDYLETFPPEKRPNDAESLSGELVRDERLTAWQAKTLLAGNVKEVAVGHYLVLQPLGKGGMGQVFKARDRRDGRIVALKVLHPESQEAADAVRRFRQEAEVAVRLRHPNIVGTYEWGEEGGLHYIAMEYVEGRDLSELSHRLGPMPLKQALGYIIQAARGLEFAHSQRAIHRDIKPANLLLDTRGTIRILDMGLARVTEAEDASAGRTLAERITRRGQMLGTVDYVSPEQAADTASADHRSDIYSLGCTLFRLLTNHPVYDGNTAIQRLIAHCESPVPCLKDSVPSATDRLQAVFERMVAKKPAERYQSMTEVIAALESCLAGTGGQAKPAPAPNVADARHDGAPETTLRGAASAREEKTVALDPPLREAAGCDAADRDAASPNAVSQKTVTPHDLTIALPDTSSNDGYTRGDRRS